MTNLGAGFPVGSPETTGPPPPSSSGPPSERDRYTEFCYVYSLLMKNKIINSLHETVGVFFLITPFLLVFCSRQLMPPPQLPVNGVRPKMEERRAPKGLVGKGIVQWIDKIPAQIHSP